LFTGWEYLPTTKGAVGCKPSAIAPQLQALLVASCKDSQGPDSLRACVQRLACPKL